MVDWGGVKVVDQWVEVMLLMVDWGGAVVCGLVSGDWKVFGGLVGGYVVDGWVDLGLGGSCVLDGWLEFLYWVCLGFEMSFCAGGFGSSRW